MDRKYKVLIVDDIEDTRALIRKYLEKEGHIIVGEANNGKDAISLFKDVSPEIITMDINMPEMNGISAMEKIYSIDTCAKIIVISGTRSAEDIEKAKEFPIAGFLKKPFQPSYLLNRLDDIAISEIEIGAANSFANKAEEAIFKAENGQAKESQALTSTSSELKANQSLTAKPAKPVTVEEILGEEEGEAVYISEISEQVDVCDVFGEEVIDLQEANSPSETEEEIEDDVLGNLPISKTEEYFDKIKTKDMDHVINEIVKKDIDPEKENSKTPIDNSEDSKTPDKEEPAENEVIVFKADPSKYTPLKDNFEPVRREPKNVEHIYVRPPSFETEDQKEEELEEKKKKGFISRIFSKKQ